MNPRQGARGLAIGRAAFGAALLLAPERVGKGWLGEYAERPAVHALIRSIGIRDRYGSSRAPSYEPSEAVSSLALALAALARPAVISVTSICVRS